MIKSNIIYASISLFSIFLQQTSACRQAIVTYSTEYECDLDHFDTAIAEDCKKLAEGIGKQGKKFAEPPISFFVNGKGRAESLRDRLVEHHDRRHLVIDARPASLATVDIGNVVHQMIELVKSSLRDPKMATRLLLEFSTTTENDRATAAMAFLGTMQNYFTYEFRVGCGFPSVTLMGDREDWLKISEGLDVLSSLGDEAVPWSVCLSKVLEYMVASFDRPRDEDVKSFWMRAVHESGRNGSRAVVTLTGWLTAFSWWDPSDDRQRTLLSYSMPERVEIRPSVYSHWPDLSGAPLATPCPTWKSRRVPWVL
ncbi:Uncharacterized protein CGCF413_v000002 [Colletotrichum fructicola]|nr:Uncharacterized protein CGCF413_v000002 [Colletotrichum fructicola]